MRVRRLDQNGQPLKTPGKPESKPITGAALVEEVRWQKSVPTILGKPVRLELRLRNAALFGFEFGF